MKKEHQELLNEIFLGKEDPDLAFKKPMTNNLKEEIKNIMDSYIRRDLEELIDIDGAEEEFYALINQKEKELLEKVEEAIGEDERLRLQATPSTMTLGEAKNQWRQELRDRIKQLKEELKGGEQ